MSIDEKAFSIAYDDLARRNKVCAYVEELRIFIDNYESAKLSKSSGFVSLEKCSNVAQEAMVKTDSWKNDDMREIAKAVLDAAGVAYAD